MSGRVCPKHLRQPAILYGACIGCELDRERGAAATLEARCQQLEDLLRAQEAPAEGTDDQLVLRLLSGLTRGHATFGQIARLAQELQLRGVQPRDAMGLPLVEEAGREQLLLLLARHRLREQHYFERCVALEAERNEWKEYAEALQQGRR